MFKTAATAALILAATTASSFAQTAPLASGNFLAQTVFQNVTDLTGSGICSDLGLVTGNINYGVANIGAYNGTSSASTQVLVNSVAATSTSAAALNPATCVSTYPALSLPTGTPLTPVPTVLTGSAVCSGAQGTFGLTNAEGTNGLPQTSATAIGAGTTGVTAFVLEEGAFLTTTLAVSSADPSGAICAMAIESVVTYSGQ